MQWELVKKDSTGQLTVSTASATILAAIIGLGPPLLDRVWIAKAQDATVALEGDKFDLERRKAAAALFQAVLANPDPAQRHMLVRFLVAAKVIDDNSAVAQLPSEQLSYWPTWSATAP